MDYTIVIIDFFSLAVYSALSLFTILFRKNLFEKFPYFITIAFCSIFFCFLNILEWTGINPQIDQLGDFLGVIVSLVFLFLSYIIINEEQKKETLRKAREIAILNEISHLIVREFNLNKLLENFLEMILKLLNFEIGGIYFIEEERKQRVLSVEIGLSEIAKEKLKRIEILRGIAGEAIRSKSFVSMKISEYPDRELKDILKKEGVKFLLSVPLFERDKIIGVINLCSKKDVELDTDTFTLIETISHHLSSAIENIKLYKDLEESYKRLKETQKQLVQAESLAKIAKFSTVIAHEVRNPLSAISMAVESLKDELKLNEEDKKLFDIIQKEVKRLNTTITDFLKFARPKEPEFENVEICSILDDILILIEKEKRENIKIEKNYAGKKCYISADAELLRSVFSNIVLNSIQAVENNKEGVISIDLFEEEEYCKIYITDNGCGIKKEDMEKIFDPFYSTKKNGTGMGLTIAYYIVLKHRGTIEVESEEGKTTFKIVLPKKQ